MALFDPAHPGALIRETLEGIFEITGKRLTVVEVATGLGTTRKTLSAIINEKQSMTPEMALRLEAAFANTTAKFRLTVQENYDLAQARDRVATSAITVFWKLAQAYNLVWQEMGLQIRSLATVPDVKLNYYVYLLDYGWHEPLAQALYDNFRKMSAIASDNNAVVVRSADDSVHFSSDVFSWHSINGVNAEMALPAIMITDRHPQDFRANRVTERGDAGDYKIILFPLKKYCKTTADVVSYVEKIFSDIVERKNLADFRVVKEMKKGFGSALVDGILLEPNYNGIGFNLKPIIDYLREK